MQVSTRRSISSDSSGVPKNALFFFLSITISVGSGARSGTISAPRVSRKYSVSPPPSDRSDHAPRAQLGDPLARNMQQAAQDVVGAAAKCRTQMLDAAGCHRQARHHVRHHDLAGTRVLHSFQVAARGVVRILKNL